MYWGESDGTQRCIEAAPILSKTEVVDIAQLDSGNSEQIRIDMSRLEVEWLKFPVDHVWHTLVINERVLTSAVREPVSKRIMELGPEYHLAHEGSQWFLIGLGFAKQPTKHKGIGIYWIYVRDLREVTVEIKDGMVIHWEENKQRRKEAK